MKHIIVMVAVAALLLVACPKEESPLGMEGEDTMVYAPSGDQTVTILGTRYFEKKTSEDGKVSFNHLGYLKKGTAVNLLDGETYEFKIEGDNYKVGPARLEDGKEVYVALWYLLPKQQLGVITSQTETRVYAGLKPTDVTKIVLPRRTMVGVQPISMVEGDNELNRQRIVCYEDVNAQKLYLGSWKTYYVSGSDVSTREQDIKMANYLATLEKIEDKSLWNDVLEDAIKVCPDSVFVPDAREIQRQLSQVGADEGDMTEDMPRETMDVSLFGYINDNDVNVRSAPNEKNSDIMGKLNEGTPVTVTRRTTRRYQVSGTEAFWYFVENEGAISGWVFGSFLDIEK
ncbi:MAG TPA: SH3 domain-containing protein [Spirochaetia bacterium]|nr:SH3 domain-containing protein [Spirochaetia bacterium]